MSSRTEARRLAGAILTGMGARGDDAERDHELVRDALRGDQAAVDTFMDRMRCVPRMLAAKNRRYGNPLQVNELEDAIQETLAAVWRKLETYDGRASLETWARRFAFFEFLMALKRRRGLPSPLLHQPLGEAEASTGDYSASDFEPLLATLQTLEPVIAEVITLKHFEDLSFPQLAKRLGIPSGTLKTRYYRGLRELRRRLGRQKDSGDGRAR